MTKLSFFLSLLRALWNLQGGSNMTGTDLCVNKPHCAAAVLPWESEATTSILPSARVRTCSVLSGSYESDEQLWGESVPVIFEPPCIYCSLTNIWNFIKLGKV